MLETVVSKSRDDVDMRVKNQLSGGWFVVPTDVNAVSARGVFNREGDFFDKRALFFEQFVWHVKKIAEMLFGQDKRVA